MHTNPRCAPPLGALLIACTVFGASGEGAHDACFARLEAATAKYDAMPYDEPAGYLMSPRQTHGALLAEQRHFRAAVPVYDADLELFPTNVWSLAGLRLCLRELADDSARLAAVEAAYAAASAKADVRVCASCACALGSWADRP